MPDLSLKDQILAARAARTNGETKDFPIPGYGRRLWATFRALDDYADLRKIGKASEGIADEATSELYVAADTLIRACVDTFAMIDNEKHPLDAKLGLPLARYLEMTASETDRQAVLGEIFPSTMSVMDLYVEYDQWARDVRRGVDKSVEGESGAPS